MLELKKYKADIEDNKSDFGMTVEFWANDKEQAKRKLNWLIGHDKDYKDLQEIEE